MTLAAYEAALRAAREMWFASGCPMDRATSPLRRRYVYLSNRVGDLRAALIRQTMFAPAVRHDLGRFMARQPGEPPLTVGGARERLAEIARARLTPTPTED